MQRVDPVTYPDGTVVLSGKSPSSHYALPFHRSVQSGGADWGTRQPPMTIIEGVTIKPTAVGQIGIHIDYERNGLNDSHHFPHVRISDVVLDVASRTTPTPFMYGVSLRDVWMSNVENVLVRGKTNAPYHELASSSGLIAGFRVNGCMDVTFNNCSVLWATCGADFSGYNESVSLNNGELVAVYKGVIGSSIGGRATIQNNIRNMHINAYTRAIDLLNGAQTHIQDNHLYRWPDHQGDFVAVHLGSCQNVVVQGNQMIDPSGQDQGRDNGIVLSGTTRDSLIQGNLMSRFDTAVWAKSESRNNRIYDNFGSVVDHGVDNLVRL